MKKGIVMLISAAVLLTGCSDYRILDRIGIIQTIAYDGLEEGRYKVTASIPRTDPFTKLTREVLTAEGTSSKETRIKMGMRTNQMLVNGQLRDVLFSVDFARKGVVDQIDSLLRDSNISPQTKIVLVNGNAEKLISKRYKQHPLTDKYIDRLLAKESQSHIIPKTTLYTFERDMLDDGIDAVVPMIKDEGEHIAIDGGGLFQDDRYVMRVAPNDVMILAILLGSFRDGEINLELGGDSKSRETVMFNSIIGKRKIRVSKGNDGKLAVVVEVRLKGSIREYNGDKKLSNDAERKQLQQQIAEKLSERATKLVQSMQANDVDPIGIGMHVRNHIGYGAWKRIEDWNKEFANVPTDCRIRFKIKDIGKLR